MPKTNVSHTKPSGAKLSDLALVLLSHAANRDDRMLLPPAELDQSPGRRFAEGADETPEAGARRRDRSELIRTGVAFGRGGDRIGLRITDAGLTAIGVPARPTPRRPKLGGRSPRHAVICNRMQPQATTPAHPPLRSCRREARFQAGAAGQGAVSIGRRHDPAPRRHARLAAPHGQGSADRTAAEGLRRRPREEPKGGDGLSRNSTGTEPD